VAAACERSRSERCATSQSRDDTSRRRRQGAQDRTDEPRRRRGALRRIVDHAGAVALGDSTRQFIVANSDGLFAGDHQVRTRFNVSCIAKGDTGMQTGYRPIAGTRGFELLSADAVADAARGAARQAITKLDARPAPSGDLPVVLAGGSGGILFTKRAVTDSRPTRSSSRPRSTPARSVNWSRALW